MFILELTDSEHKAQTSETGDITSELPPTTEGAANGGSPMLTDRNTRTPFPSAGTHRRPAVEPGTGPAERRERVLSVEPGLASSKTQKPL